MGALVALAAPLAACEGGYDDSPDPLVPLMRAARADAKAARELARAGRDATLANAVSRVRSAHADALSAEVQRANRPTPSSVPPGGKVADLAALGKRLTTARAAAAELVPSAARYRAGLIGSVAAGCAAVQALSSRLGEVRMPEFAVLAAGAESLADSVPALQTALDAEHAAVWTYGLVAAFLPDTFDAALDGAADEHRARREAVRGVLADAGVTPHPAEAAYVPPRPVTDAKSAQALVITAESDAMVVWRGVLERTDDGVLRRLALDALVASAVRGSRWRAEAGITPSAFALPGVR